MPRRPPLILLPPSEGKAAGGTGPAWSAGSMSAPELDDRRARVMAALVRAMAGSEKRRAALLGVKGEALAAATAADLDVADAPTLPAIERYTGVLYGALDLGSLPAALTASDRRGRCGSCQGCGVWSRRATRSPTTSSRCRRRCLGWAGSSTWWRPAVTAALAPEVEGRTVWDLLPNEHRAAWAPTWSDPTRRARSSASASSTRSSATAAASS